ncbi:MAG: DUF6984 family protein [Flavisolibacter sp.]
MQRKITDEEKTLIQFLLNRSGESYDIPELVSELKDGGMGSLRLADSGIHARDIIQVKYVDSDNVLVFITLTQNDSNQLFELDMWKVDFEPLRKFPTPEKLEEV